MTHQPHHRASSLASGGGSEPVRRRIDVEGVMPALRIGDWAGAVSP
jgi:hypothetical protein